MASEDFLGTILIIFLTLVVVAAMLPKLLDMIAESFALTSAESVSRQLSNLITISGASTDQIKINYAVENVKYDVSISTRVLTMTPKYNVQYAEAKQGIQPFAIPLPDSFYGDVNSFTITKKLVEGESQYDFGAQ